MTQKLPKGNNLDNCPRGHEIAVSIRSLWDMYVDKLFLTDNTI